MEKLGGLEDLDLDDSDLDDMELPKASGTLANLLKGVKPEEDDLDFAKPGDKAEKKADVAIYRVVEPTPRFGVRYNADLE